MEDQKPDLAEVELTLTSSFTLHIPERRLVLLLSGPWLLQDAANGWKWLFGFWAQSGRSFPGTDKV